MSASIHGITQISGPRNLNSIRGHLTIPENFPEEKYSCKWSKVGPNVERDAQPETIPGTSLVAPGWKVWKDPKTQKPVERSLGNGKYILMVRPKDLQKTLQKIYGNISRDRMEAEQRGETVAGEVRIDDGVFGFEQLKRIPGLSSEDSEELKLPRNQVGSFEEETATKAQTKRK